MVTRIVYAGQCSFGGLCKTCCNDQIVILHGAPRAQTYCNLDICPRMVEV